MEYSGIIGCISGYNDAYLLGDCIKSLRMACNRIIYVDGSYVGFPVENGSHHSTDGSMGLAAGLCDEVIPAGKAPWKNQWEKRSEYLLGQKGDWYLHLDTDERLEVLDWGFVSSLRGNSAFAYNVEFGQDGKTHPYFWVRTFRHENGIRYDGAHNAIWYGSKLLNPQECPVIGGIKIHHSPELRSAERIASAKKYYAYQYELERDFRREHQCL